MVCNYPIELKIGDKVFVDTFFDFKNPISWLAYCIRKIAKIPFNHLRVVAEKDGKIGFIQAVEEGVVFNELYYHPKKERVMVMRNGEPINEEKYNRELISIENKKYDFVNLFWTQLIHNLFSIWIGAKNEEQAKNRFICYEIGFLVDRLEIKKEFGIEWYKLKPLQYYESQFMDLIYLD